MLDIEDTQGTPALTAAPQPFGYVVFDENGALVESCFQVPPAAHAGRWIGVDEATRDNWTAYRANAARDGVELLPPITPLVDLAALKTAALSQTYADVDRVYADAVGNRATEYQEAEQAARDYAAAGYAGAASEYVSDYALNNPTLEAQTNQWAADEIIARADAFRTAQKAMRSKRFECQAAMRAAATADELEQAIAQWAGFIAGLRAALEL